MAGTGLYDIALPATYALPDLVVGDAVVPLDILISKYEPAGFRDGVFYSTGDGFEGTTYGFQTDGDAYGMFYNQGFLHDRVRQVRYAETFW